MSKGFYISRSLGLVGVALGAAAMATIMALSMVYHQEKSRGGGGPRTTPPPPSSSSSPSSPPGPQEPWQRYRLPGSLVPLSYNITLWPRLEPDQQGLFIFSGHSAVVFLCLQNTDLILIHSNKLNFTIFQGHWAQLSAPDGAPTPHIQRSWWEEATQYLVLQLRGPLLAGRKYVLQTEFRGELADDLEGLYRSQYTEDGVHKVLAASQMQATYARKVFPCFDEPVMKAVFNVTLIHEPGTVALSNSQEREFVVIVMDGLSVRKTTFDPTERMSTYLLAFLVCSFSFIQQDAGVTIRIWARRDALWAGQGHYALNVTGRILEFYQQYYNTSYPLSKSDQVALPDFHAGAMENWGLVTYRETALLFDPAHSSTSSRQRIATVIAHELAHMWFGNLVTMKWWNDLWLNEGFASYVEYLGADHAERSWDIKQHMVLYEVQRVFQVDALLSSHPLSHTEEQVQRPEQINQMFNSISYSKGAAVLRMLSEFLTEPVFAKGLSSYLRRFAFSNTECRDLWEHLQQAVDDTPSMQLPRPVHDIMDRWILQMGFPLVSINTSSGRISQQHFLLDPGAVVDRPSPFNYTWMVPVQWMKNGVEQQPLWLLEETDVYPSMRTSGQDWVLVNSNVSGYFRVNYDLDNWERLLTLLQTDHQAVPVINRAQILDDAFNLARAGVVGSTLALRTTLYLRHETHFVPWEAALNNLHYYTLMLERSEVQGALQAYLRQQIQPLFHHFQVLTSNWTQVPAGHNDQYNQVNALDVACRVGVARCRSLTSRWFRLWMENPEQNPIHPNLRRTVYCSAIATGGQDEWDFAWKMFQNVTVATEAASLRSALACTKEPWLLNRYLQWTLDRTRIRKQDVASSIQAVARNVVGAPLAWSFIRANWEHMVQTYGQGSFSFSKLITEITARFSTEFELQQLQQFKLANQHLGFGSSGLALDQALERTTANIRWMKENREKVLTWLSHCT